ncbi:hypothetical protein D9M73_292750 [compost metagenome]
MHWLSHRDAVLLRAVVLDHVGRDQALIGALAQDRRKGIVCTATGALIESAIRLLKVGRCYSVVPAALGDASDRFGNWSTDAAAAQGDQVGGDQREVPALDLGYLRPKRLLSIEGPLC